MNMKKAQVATEFFMYTAVFMFVVIAAFVIVNQIQSTEIPLRENTIAKSTGEFFVSAITLSVKAGQGFTYNYTFPKTILDNPYTLSFAPKNSIMVLDWEGRYGKFSQSYNLPPYNYSFVDPGGADNCIVQDPTAVGIVYIFNSSKCSSSLTLYNDGEKLVILHAK